MCAAQRLTAWSTPLHGATEPRAAGRSAVLVTSSQRWSTGVPSSRVWTATSTGRRVMSQPDHGLDGHGIVDPLGAQPLPARRQVLAIDVEPEGLGHRMGIRVEPHAVPRAQEPARVPRATDEAAMARGPPRRPSARIDSRSSTGPRRGGCPSSPWSCSASLTVQPMRIAVTIRRPEPSINRPMSMTSATDGGRARRGSGTRRGTAAHAPPARHRPRHLTHSRPVSSTRPRTPSPRARRAAQALKHAGPEQRTDTSQSMRPGAPMPPNIGWRVRTHSR